MLQNNFVKFFSYIARDYPKQLFLLVLFTFFATSLELIGFSALIPVISLLDDTTGNSQLNDNFIVDFFVSLGLDASLELLLLFIVGLFLLKGLCVFFVEYFQQRIRVNTHTDIRKGVYQGAMQASWSFVQKTSVGKLNNAIVTQSRNSAVGITHMSNFIVSSVYVAFFFLFAVFISWQIVLISAGVFSALYLLFRFMFKRSHTLGKAIGECENEINKITVSSFVSPKTIKGSALESFFSTWFINTVEKARNTETKYAKIMAVLSSIPEPISVIFCIFVLYSLVSFYNQPLGQAVVLVLVFYRIYQKIGILPKAYAQVNYCLPLYEIGRQLKDQAKENKELSGVQQLNALEQGIEIKDVVFAYGDKTALDHISLRIKKGEFVGITGKSGGGKTTLIDLLLGLHQPKSGQVLVDNIALENYQIDSWRNKIGYVPQDTVLFHLSLAENIAIGQELDLDKVTQAAKIAHAHEFIEQLPEQYSTIFSEEGMSLSGGQKQRIALARALYRNPDILILDEATSNLDNESERLIKDAIQKLHGQMTIIAITHRLHTLDDADQIFVLDQGKIAEQGNKEQLLNNEGLFQRLVISGQES